jgi:Uma2 family endonuclease
MVQPAELGRVTEDEYLERERQAETKSELISGEIVAMAGGSPKHNAIATNVARVLGNRLEGRRCIVFNSDQRVHIPATGLYTYPDVSVACDGPKFHPKDRNTLVNPKVIVEVLSDATEAYDRSAKFSHYRSLPSFEEYVLVWQAEERVEHYRKIEPRQWLMTEHLGQDASVRVLDFDVPLREIYAKVDQL